MVFLDAFKAGEGGPRGQASWPGIAVQRTVSLPLTYVPAIPTSLFVGGDDVDARDKPGHDDVACQCTSLTHCEDFA